MSLPALDLREPALATQISGHSLVISASAGSGKTFALVSLVLGFLGTGGRAPRRTPFQSCGPNTTGRCWRAAMRVHYSSSTGPHGMATPRTRRAGHAGRSKVSSFRVTGVPGRTSRPACNPRRARDSAHLRSTCSLYEWASLRYRRDSETVSRAGGRWAFMAISLTKKQIDSALPQVAPGLCNSQVPTLKSQR